MKFIFKLVSHILRYIEVLICIRKYPYKKHFFPKKKASCEYYYNREKWRQPYA